MGVEIDRRLAEVRVAAENRTALKKGKRAAKAWMNANLMDYGVGISNTKDLLDSLAAYAKASMDLDKGAHDQWLAQDLLRAAVGEDLGKFP